MTTNNNNNNNNNNNLTPTVWSYEAVSSTLSSALYVTALMRCVWPSNRLSTRPVETSHMNAARSPPHETKLELSAERQQSTTS